jgi:hypothetical protein
MSIIEDYVFIFLSLEPNKSARFMARLPRMFKTEFFEISENSSYVFGKGVAENHALCSER